MQIPFSPPYIDQQVIDEVLHTLHSGWITTGPKVAQLEREMCKLTGAQASVCVNSWTSGAILVMKWLGVKPGDEVIIPAYTYCATALAVLHCGAIPVMVDVKDDYTIDPALVLKAMNGRTKAVIAVDIGGLPCDYNALNEVINSEYARKLYRPVGEVQVTLGRVLLIADAAHSIGAMYGNRPAALGADVSVFSFHAVKNITTAEGGCICLNLPSSFNYTKESGKIRLCSLNGQTKDAFTKSQAGEWKYDILLAGMKMNMPDICAAIGLAQIKIYHSRLLPRRRAIAQYYYDQLGTLPGFSHTPLSSEDRVSACHLFIARIDDINEEERDSIIKLIAARGIAVNVHFMPLPMLTLFKEMGYTIDHFPKSYALYSSSISLPIYPQLSHTEMDYIVAVTMAAVEEVRKVNVI